MGISALRLLETGTPSLPDRSYSRQDRARNWRDGTPVSPARVSSSPSLRSWWLSARSVAGRPLSIAQSRSTSASVRSDAPWESLSSRKSRNARTSLLRSVAMFLPPHGLIATVSCSGLNQSSPGRLLCTLTLYHKVIGDVKSSGADPGAFPVFREGEVGRMKRWACSVGLALARGGLTSILERRFCCAAVCCHGAEGARQPRFSRGRRSSRDGALVALPGNQARPALDTLSDGPSFVVVRVVTIIDRLRLAKMSQLGGVFVLVPCAPGDSARRCCRTDARKRKASSEHPPLRIALPPDRLVGRRVSSSSLWGRPPDAKIGPVCSCRAADPVRDVTTMRVCPWPTSREKRGGGDGPTSASLAGQSLPLGADALPSARPEPTVTATEETHAAVGPRPGESTPDELSHVKPSGLGLRWNGFVDSTVRVFGRSGAEWSSRG